MLIKRHNKSQVWTKKNVQYNRVEKTVGAKGTSVELTVTLLVTKDNYIIVIKESNTTDLTSLFKKNAQTELVLFYAHFTGTHKNTPKTSIRSQ